ncbi:PstS family phosphate ABC transporter substrate-binding protein [Haloarcula salinisoli]|uniref:Substrate-binding domain-containing protein n=1 Tax=Haloarcula salinisoli TaxID=2487746 RepID=A0A8J8CDB3_9EURY|nr:substrate-binding domain-containing protein [Halomicroarcula salinisoli]MBX0287176.1 substrate-binding domain-containing protein [Halomicroarcula salinisoli]MBX0304480.1 substrate-binding domain-containing protein [Halomicroarcula salinisoli]
MTQDPQRLSDSISRRKFIAAAGVAGAGAVAGCSSSEGQSATTEGKPLTADGSSTVYPITSQAGSLWNGNAPASDEEYWGPGQYGIDTDKNMADYWAGLYGFEPSGEEGTPPFYTSIGLNHTGVGLEKLEKGQVDIGDASAPVSAEFPDRSEAELSEFTDHVVAVDAQPIIVSQEIYDAGVTQLTLSDIQDIYRGNVENWSELGGPDKEIQAIGRAEGSGTDTSFRANVLGDPDASMGGVDSRNGQNQQVKTVVQETDNAVAYIALAFVDDSTPAIDLEIEGELFEYPDDFGSLDYPLSRALHTYTWDGTSKKEAAFIRMILHEYGQTMFVESNDYLPLTEERRKEELGKLPEPTN